MPLCSGVIFSSAQVLVMALRGEALTIGKVKGPVGHHCLLGAAAGVAESAGVGLSMQQGYSSAESN